MGATLSAEQLQGLAWYPKGIATSLEPRSGGPDGFAQFRLSTRWGSRDVLWPESGPSDGDWWAKVSTAEGWWGEAINLTEAKVEQLEWEDGQAWQITSAEGEELILRSLPIDRHGHGKDLAELGYAGLNSAIAGLQHQGMDVLLIFEKLDTPTASEHLMDLLHSSKDGKRAEGGELCFDIGAALGRFAAAAMDAHSTANVERLWNDRLKKLEGMTKANTLWRAPHSPTTRGTLTHRNLGLEVIHLGEDGPRFSGCFDGIFNSVVDLPPHRPAIRDLAALLHSLHNLLEREGKTALEAALRAQVIGGWKTTAPAGICSRAALDTHRGGVFIWEYEQKLESLAYHQAWQKPMPDSLKGWLRRVSRVQAQMFRDRSWSAFSLFSYFIAGGLALLWLNGDLDAVQASAAIPISGLGLLMRKFYQSSSISPNVPL